MIFALESGILYVSLRLKVKDTKPVIQDDYISTRPVLYLKLIILSILSVALILQKNGNYSTFRTKIFPNIYVFSNFSKFFTLKNHRPFDQCHITMQLIHNLRIKKCLFDSCHRKHLIKFQWHFLMCTTTYIQLWMTM